MTVGVFELFKVGIGPSSSHTVGPMRGALGFSRRMRRALDAGEIDQVHGVRVHLFGSLGATGVGHGTVSAVVLGLAGHEPQTIDPDHVPVFMNELAASGTLHLPGGPTVPFDPDQHVLLHPDTVLPGHPNGMQFEALGTDGEVVLEHRSYSVGGGFVVDEEELDGSLSQSSDVPHIPLPHPYATADQLVAMCNEHGLTVGELQWHNELATRNETEVRENLMVIWNAMRDCVARGCRSEGELPGGLGVQRRAAALHRSLASGPVDPLTALDWVNLYALAVNEENAAGGRVVTAPTNGAAGIVPAVLHYYMQFVPGADDEGVIRFLLAAAAIGSLFKRNASISGAEVGCQGEVGSACAMAAAGLAEVMGGTAAQVENAAEIALEHNLGLTCDPIGGLVQVPCIERNAMASMKAINAARLALHGDGTHLVSLDQAIETMRDTGRDMHVKYKETARGGLAVTFRTASGTVPVAVSYVEC